MVRRSGSGVSPADALVGGFHLAFAIGAVTVFVGILIALVVLRTPRVTEQSTTEVTPAAARPALRPVPAQTTVLEGVPASSPIRRRFILPFRLGDGTGHDDQHAREHQEAA